MRKLDPYKSLRFRVEIDGIVQAGFSECSGLGSTVEVIEYQEGGDSAPRKIPGKVSFSDIVLKWGITDSKELYDWHDDIVEGKLKRKNGSVILMDDLGQEKVRYNFFDAWPSKWEGPSFNASGNEVAIDTLTLSCEKVVRG